MVFTDPLLLELGLAIELYPEELRLDSDIVLGVAPPNGVKKDVAPRLHPLNSCLLGVAWCSESLSSDSAVTVIIGVFADAHFFCCCCCCVQQLSSSLFIGGRSKVTEFFRLLSGRGVGGDGSVGVLGGDDTSIIGTGETCTYIRLNN
jgi:hypothetical protein